MIFQFDYTAISWLIGIGLMFALSFSFNYLLEGNMKSFFLCLLLFNAFMVWTGLLEVWTLILCLIFAFVVLFIEIKAKRGLG